MANPPDVDQQLANGVQVFYESVGWMDEIEAQCKAGACAHSLNTLIRVGSEHLIVAERFVRALDSTRRQFGQGPELPPATRRLTCSYCGTTNPLSQVSFAYCGGCRHSGIARIDLPRYCSEACQRAHWHAGHKDECPCAKDL